MQRAGAKWLWAVCTLAGVWVGGCGRTPVESELEVSFERPAQGQRLEQDQDEDPQAEGFQYEVMAVAADSAGRTPSLAGARLEVRGQGEAEWRAGPEAVVEGAEVRFPGTLLAVGSNVLRVTVEEQGSRRTATRSVTVSVAPAAAPAVEIAEPAEGQVLREADDADPATPGYQVRFRVQTAGLTGRTGTLYCERACGVPPASFGVLAGVSEVVVTLEQASCEAQVAECHAVVSTRGGTEVRSPRRTLSLDTVAPQVEVSTPVAPLATTTFPVEAVVGCCERDSQVTLLREGAAPLTARVSSGAVSFPSVEVPGEGRFTYTLQVTDSGGNRTERAFEVQVAPQPVSLALSAPATVTEDADGEGSNGVQVDVVATTSASEPGTQVEFQTSVVGVLGLPVRVATEAVPAGGRRATYRASLAEGSNTVRACVRNPALPPTCQSLRVAVSTGRAACRIASPLPVSAQQQEALAVQVETGESPVVVRLLDAAGNERARQEASASGGRAQVQLALPEEGAWRVVAACGTSGASHEVAVQRDSTAPGLQLSVSGDEAGTGVLGPLTRDTSLQPGTQVVAAVRTEPFAAVALSGCNDSNAQRVEADAQGNAVLRNITLQATGSCTLSVTARDAAGNETRQGKALALRGGEPKVVLLAPASERSLGPEDGTVAPGGGLTVNVRTLVSAESEGELQLWLGTTRVGTQAIQASVAPREVVFNGVVLAPGFNVLRTTLVGSGRVLACDTLALTVDTAPRTLTLARPVSTAATYSRSADVNANVPGIQASLQYQAAGASARARADVCTSLPLVPGAAPCRDGSGFFTLAAGVPPFVPDFTYPDGEYQLKVVLEDGGRLVATPPVSITVDSVRPRVARVTFEADANGDGQLNLAEQSSGAPAALVTAVGLEDGSVVQVRDASTSTPFGQATALAGSARVVLSGLPNLVERRYSLVAIVTDRVGNANQVSVAAPLDPLNLEAFTSLRVDRSAPALEVSAPSRGVLGRADDADPAQAGHQVRFTLTTGTDVGADGVSISSTPAGLALTTTPAGGLVNALITAPGSGTTSYEVRLQAMDEAGNTTSRTLNLTLDLEPPDLTPVTPASGATLDSARVTLRATVQGAEGRTVNVVTFPADNSGPLPVAALTVASGAATGEANLPLGVQDLRFEVSDAAGNLASATVMNVNVTFAGCDQRFTRPAGTPVTLLARDDLQPGVPDLQYRLEGVTRVCRGRQVRLYRGSATTPEATATADATTGAFAFDITLPDVQTTTLRLEMDDGSTATSVTSDISVDIVPPAIADVVPAAASLLFVAASNEAFFRTPVPADYVSDRVPGGDAEAELSFRVTGASGGSVRVLYGGVDVAVSVTPDSDDRALVVPVTLPHGTANTLEIVVRDTSGNEVRRSASATVDVQPPDAPSVQANVVAGAERTASVQVQWTAVGDDGASGMPAGYDLRWTTEAALPGGISTEALFFNGRVQRATGALLPAADTSFTLTPLPPLATYSLQLRARDEVGNYSPFAAPRTVSNFLGTLELTKPGGGTSDTNFGRVMSANGDLDGLAGDELVVGEPARSSLQGAVHVYSGISDPPQTLTPPDTLAQSFGTDLGIGNVGDAAGEGKPDLLVGAPGWSSGGGTSNVGRAFLYFGRSGAGLRGVDPTPIEFRGQVNAGIFGITSRIISDINRDGLGEVVITASTVNGVGRVYLFFGRTRAQWEALRVDSSSGLGCTVGSTSCHIPATRADRIFEADAALPGTTTFGRQHGLVGLGDITGDGYGEFSIPASRNTVNRFYLYSGMTVVDTPTPSSIPVSSALQLLTQTPGAETTNRYDGFGAAALGGLDFVGGSGLDMVVSRSSTSSVFVYADGGPTGFPNAPLTITGGGGFGFSLARADFNGDGRLDLVIGTNVRPNGSLWIFLHRGVAGAEFEISAGGFQQTRLTASSAQNLGLSVAAGDFNGDGRPDVAAGDTLDSGGRVRIWY